MTTWPSSHEGLLRSLFPRHPLSWLWRALLTYFIAIAISAFSFSIIASTIAEDYSVLFSIISLSAAVSLGYIAIQHTNRAIKRERDMALDALKRAEALEDLIAKLQEDGKQKQVLAGARDGFLDLANRLLDTVNTRSISYTLVSTISHYIPIFMHASHNKDGEAKTK